MKIALLAAFAGANSGGPDTMEAELVRGLAALDQENEYRVFCLLPNGQTSIGVSQPNFRFERLWPGLRPVSMLSTLPYRLLRTRPHVFHAPTVPPPLPRPSYLFTLNCSAPFVHPELLPSRSRRRLQFLANAGIRKARLILCVSQSVRDLVLERFRIHPDRLRVVYLGVSPMFHPMPASEVQRAVQERHGINFPYFFYCARYEHRKNLLGLADAWHLFKRETRLPHKLVMTGSSTPLIEEFRRRIRRHRLEEEVLDLGKVPRQELPALYGAAEALVYPSLWEGFGMPLVEAMACGTPVITSNLSSMPEITGGAALLVNPHSPLSIAAAMHHMSTDSALRDGLRNKGLERSKVFSWQRTARETLAAYYQMASA